uniref:Uncharacterized protein n=1 Tax=Tetraselmis chuii TaxID=63592 RepID=A0A7S1X9D1_9CHLO
MWQALLPQLCAEDALHKGEAGYKQWSELREYLFLVGWVGADLPDGHPLQPDEAVTETVEGYMELLPKFSEALAKLDSNAETADNGKKKKAKEGAMKDAHGLSIERLAQGLGNRRNNLKAMRGAADGQSIVRSVDEAPSGYGSDELSGELHVYPDVVDVIKLTAEEKAQRELCTWPSFASLPLLSLGCTELPEPWSFLDFKELGEDAEATTALDVKMLMARRILQHQEGGTGATDEVGMGCLHDMLEAAKRLLHFPQMHLLDDGGPPVRGNEASADRLSSYFKARRKEVERLIGVLKLKIDEERVQAVKYVGMAMASDALRLLDQRSIDRTPERAQ